MPFSGGPAMCPGRNVVLLVASTVLARLLQQRTFSGSPIDPARPVPASLNPFGLRFTATA